LSIVRTAYRFAGVVFGVVGVAVVAVVAVVVAVG
jgi:hypothetical protein